jgi:Fe2+ or Zn2+ uptake regulation protein
MNFRSKLFKVLSCVFETNKQFTLSEVYQISEGPMSYYYPNNNTIRASIRENLQQLRDEGFLTFVDNKGTYSFT